MQSYTEFAGDWNSNVNYDYTARSDGTCHFFLFSIKEEITKVETCFPLQPYRSIFFCIYRSIYNVIYSTSVECSEDKDTHFGTKYRKHI